jgi:1-acyl-sn-glycerol-3-phosphate acyltransferase
LPETHTSVSAEPVEAKLAQNSVNPETPQLAVGASNGVSNYAPITNFLSHLRSYFIYDPLIWGYTLFLGVVSLACSPFDRSGRIQHKFAKLWSWLILKTIVSPVKVVGLDKIDTTKPLVYAVNHSSALDIPVLYTSLPFQFRIIFKKELLSYPFVGWHLKRSGQICIDQQNPAASISTVRAGLKTLKAGMPLVIFPEGGRTPDGKLQPFMPGAFFLAIKAGVDVVPVTLSGMYELLPMNTYHIKSRPLEMRVGEPIPTSGYTLRTMDQLAARVHAMMEKMASQA